MKEGGRGCERTRGEGVLECPNPELASLAAIGLEDQLLIHEEVHLPLSLSLQVVFE